MRWTLIAIGLLVLLGVGAYLLFSKGGLTPGGGNGNVNGTNEGSRTPVTVPTDTTPPDEDGDGLSDADEATAGTNPALVDSDADGLTDREEVRVYSTNPLVVDTDADGSSDGEEVKAGNNPNGSGLLLDLQKAITNVAD